MSASSRLSILRASQSRQSPQRSASNGNEQLTGSVWIYAAVAVAARFLTTWRLSSSARGDSSASLALSKKVSSPPRWSTVLSALAEMRKRTERLSASDNSVTLSRLGRNRRLVLRFEWLTRLPIWRVFPVSSQRHDMVVVPQKCCRSSKVPPRPTPPNDDVGCGRTYNQGSPQRQAHVRQAYVRTRFMGRAKPQKRRIPERDRAWGFQAKAVSGRQR